MDHDRRAWMTPFRRDLVLSFAALSVGSVAAALYLYIGAGQDASEVQFLLSIFMVGVALMIYIAVFVRNA